MEKVIEFNLNDNALKNYLVECLEEKNITYEIKIEDRWIQKFKNPSQFYQVYCLYVKKEDLTSVEEIINNYKNAEIITDDIEELKDIENEEDDYSKDATKRSLFKFYLAAIVLLGILIIIGINLIH